MKLKMYETRDRRKWSKIVINNTEIEMLWDSGASVSVMSERSWRKIGKPSLRESMIELCGVFSTGMEKPIGSMTIEADWKGKKRVINVIIVKDIRPDFIGGVDTMERTQKSSNMR